MALSVVKRPITFRYDETATFNTAAFTSGSATLTDTAHGLSTGNYVYLSTGQYIGFWYVNKLTDDTFEIREYATATSKTFYGTGDVSWLRAYPASDYNFNALHNPIVYKLASTLWPTNSVDTARTVSSYSNDLGYAKLTLSGSLGTISELEFVKVTFTGGETAVYQILTWYSSSIVTINLPYVGGLTFVSVQKYYTDYHAKVNVYAGLDSNHTLTTLNPIELLCEIKAVPDSEGVITININEFLKEKIDILKNELNKVRGTGTMYNDVSQFCQFYITFAEAYTYSEGGYTLLDYVGSYTDDSGNGKFYAVNASMPFKNVYSGMMSAYCYEGTPGILKQKFLTPMSEPTLFTVTSRTAGQVSQFFDISFIRNLSNSTAMRIRFEAVRGGQIVGQGLDVLPSYDVGVYRYEVDRSVFEEDEIYITLEADNGATYIPISETVVITIDDSCSPSDNFIDLSWKNYLGAMDYWRFKSLSEYGVDILKTTEADKNFYPTWPNSWGEDADTLNQETSRESVQTLTVRAENLTETQVQDLFRIKLSPLVQIVNSRTDRRTVIPDKGSFVYFKEGEKNYSITLTLTYTDKFPAQSL